MIKAEKKVLEYIKLHMPLAVSVLFLTLGIVVRIKLRDVISGDYAGFLFPWYEEIGAHGLSQQVGDYNFLYQFMIWIFTKLQVYPLYAYKAVSCAFDFVLAFTGGLIAYENTSQHKKWGGVFAFCAIWLSPMVFLNSAAWAQCDAIYSAFAVLSLYFLLKEKYTAAFILLGVSFTFKFHAVFVLPFFLYIYFVKEEFSIARFLTIPAVMCVLSAPLVFWGRNLLEIFVIYVKQTSSYQAMSMNYPSAWLILCKAMDAGQYFLLKAVAIIITVFVLALLMLWWIRKNCEPSGKKFYFMAFLLIYTCVLFLPSMHERYGYLYEILAILLAVLIPKTIPLCVGLLCVSLNTYGAFLFGIPIQLPLLSCVNIAVYMAYIFIFKREFIQMNKYERSKKI